MTNVDAFPLAWPAGWVRSPRRARAAFKSSFTKARDGLLNEVRLMGGRQVVLSTNVPLRNDGLPMALRAQPQDPGVAVYFTRGGRRVVLACDRWDRIEDNLHALELTVAAMRGITRWGASELLDRAFTGFTALPAPQPEGPRLWHEVLEVSPSASAYDIRFAYRRLAATHHPDRGGDPARMAEINLAYEQAQGAQA